VFDPRFLQHVVCIDHEAIYVTDGQKFLDEKYYNSARFIKVLESYIFKPDDGTATWRDYNFLYGTCIYAGMIPGKTRKEGADRMIKFALYGLSYPRTWTLCFYKEYHPELFPPEKVDIDYVNALKNYLEYVYNRLDYTASLCEEDISFL
jgi:hypothetical protein